MTEQRRMKQLTIIIPNSLYDPRYVKSYNYNPVEPISLEKLAARQLPSNQLKFLPEMISAPIAAERIQKAYSNHKRFVRVLNNPQNHTKSRLLFAITNFIDNFIMI